MHPLMIALDTDRDGEISADEIDSAPTVLKKLDRNQDGKLTPDELMPEGGPGFGRQGRGGFGRQGEGGFGPGGRFGGPGMGGRGQGGPGRGGFGGPDPGPGGPPTTDTGELNFQSAPVPKDDAEEKILAVLNDLDQNQRRGMMNVPEEDGRLLRLLAETIGAKRVVEIGTSNGYSGIWFSLALRNTGGKLITHEIDAGRAELARQNFERAGVEEYIELVEGDAHEEVKNLKGPIDLLFLDADKEGYLDYLDTLLPLVRPGGLVVAHNMNARQAYPPFVKAITTNPNLETLFVHMDRAGVAISMKKH
jgi:predicted O-methyltransferase YrrM